MAATDFRISDFTRDELDWVLARFSRMGVPYEVDSDFIRVPESHASLAERLVAMGPSEPVAAVNQPAATPSPASPPSASMSAPAGGSEARAASAPTFPAGWYALPDQAQERYWDGTGWTGAYRPIIQGFGPGGPAPRPVGSQPPYHGMAIASMVLGICSLVLWYLGVVTGILGLIFGVLSLKHVEPQGHKRGRGMALAGIICSIVALAIWILVLFVFIVAGSDW